MAGTREAPGAPWRRLHCAGIAIACSVLWQGAASGGGEPAERGGAARPSACPVVGSQRMGLEGPGKDGSPVAQCSALSCMLLHAHLKYHLLIIEALPVFPLP